MIYTYIRDFLVTYIFGGHTSDGDSFGGLVGHFRTTESGIGPGFIDDTYLPLSGYNDYIGDNIEGICLGDWLSTTFTIIIMCMIVAFCIWLVRWIFKAVSSAMLLK